MKIANQYLVALYLLILANILVVGLVKHYGYNKQQSNNLHVPQYAEAKEIDSGVLAREKQRQIEINKVRTFLTKYNSPLTPYSDVIVDEAYIYGIDYKVITSIAGVESTFCKFPAPDAKYNCWGWTSTTAPSHFYRFTSYREAISYITEKLANDRAYTTFQQTKSISDLAEHYNNGSQSWINSLNWFIERI